MKYSYILFVLFFLGCKGRTQPDDITLKRNQAMYHFVFNNVNEELKSEWIVRHFGSLTGNHLKTLSSEGVIGNSYESIRIVEFNEQKTKEEIKIENREVFDSLRKKVNFNVEIRVGN